MPETSMFFDSTEADERMYSSADFAQFMKIFYSTGVVSGGDSLKVLGSADRLAVSVQPGKAVVEGRPYWLTESARELTVPAASTSYARIDRVILRLDLSVEARNITAQILQGQAAANPKPPNLLRNNNYYDISLAQLYIPANALVIEKVTDERYNAEVCGICQGLYTLDMTDFEDLNEFLGPFQSHVNNTSIHVTDTEKTYWDEKTDKSDHQIKTYVGLDQVGLTIGSETIDAIAEALPDKSTLLFSTGAKNAAIYPTSYGFVEITRLEYTRIKFSFIPKNTGAKAVQEYIGHAYQENGTWYWSGWACCVASTDVTNIVVSDKAPTSASAGQITFVYET